jgi:hypothetical protein
VAAEFCLQNEQWKLNRMRKWAGKSFCPEFRTMLDRKRGKFESGDNEATEFHRTTGEQAA